MMAGAMSAQQVSVCTGNSLSVVPACCKQQATARHCLLSYLVIQPKLVVVLTQQQLSYLPDDAVRPQAICAPAFIDPSKVARRARLV